MTSRLHNRSTTPHSRGVNQEDSARTTEQAGFAENPKPAGEERASAGCFER